VKELACVCVCMMYDVCALRDLRLLRDGQAEDLVAQDHIQK